MTLLLRLTALAVALSIACRGTAEPGRRGAQPRVVSLHDVPTEMMVALGATARLVGVGDPVDLATDARAAIAGVPRVGGLESILAVRPTVVLGMATIAERDPELVSALRGAGIDVYLPGPAVLDDVYTIVQQVARRADVVAAGESLVAATKGRIGSAVPARSPLRVFVYDCCDPPFTAGGQTVLSDLIRHAGGKNVFADQATDWTHVSWEEVVARRPELVVVDSYTYDGQGDTDDKVKALRAIPTLEKVPVAVMPLGCALGGLRSVEGLGRLERAIREERP